MLVLNVNIVVMIARQTQRYALQISALSQGLIQIGLLMIKKKLRFDANERRKSDSSNGGNI